MPAGTELTEADLAALAKAKGLDAGAISGNVSAPLTPKEVEVYRKVQEAIKSRWQEKDAAYRDWARSPSSWGDVEEAGNKD